MANVRLQHQLVLGYLLVTVGIVSTTGCAGAYHALHYNCLSRALHDHTKSYYHSEQTGRIIPKDCNYCPSEPPCHGYEPTCWRRWPAECEKCPVADGYENGHIIIHEEEIVPTPASESAEAQNDSAIVQDVEPTEAVTDESASDIPPNDFVAPDDIVDEPDGLDELTPDGDLSPDGAASNRREFNPTATSPATRITESDRQEFYDLSTEPQKKSLRPAVPAEIPELPRDEPSGTRSLQKDISFASQEPTTSIDLHSELASDLAGDLASDLASDRVATEQITPIQSAEPTDATPTDATTTDQLTSDIELIDDELKMGDVASEGPKPTPVVAAREFNVEAADEFDFTLLQTASSAPVARVASRPVSRAPNRIQLLQSRRELVATSQTVSKPVRQIPSFRMPKTRSAKPSEPSQPPAKSSSGKSSIRFISDSNLDTQGSPAPVIRGSSSVHFR